MRELSFLLFYSRCTGIAVSFGHSSHDLKLGQQGVSEVSVVNAALQVYSHGLFYSFTPCVPVLLSPLVTPHMT